MFYLIGPNVRVFGPQLQDLLFLTYFLLIFSDSVIKRQAVRIPFFLYLSALVITLSFLGKYLNGFSLSSDDFFGLIKHLNLVAISYVTIYIFTQKQNAAHIENHFDKLIHILSISVIFTSALAVIQYFFPDEFFSVFSQIYEITSEEKNFSNFLQGEFERRTTSIFVSPIIFGAFLSYSLAFIWINGFKTDVNLRRLAIILGGIVLILSNARAATIALIAGVIFSVLNSKNKMNFIFYGTLFLILIQFLASTITYSNLERFNEITMYVSSGFNAHLMPYNMEGRIINDTIVYQLYLKSKYIIFGYPNVLFESDIAMSVMNQFIRWFTRYGIFAVPLIIWNFAIIGYYYVLYRKCTDTTCKRFLFSITILLLMSFIIGLTQDSIFLPRWREYLFILLPFSLVYYKWVEFKNNEIGSEVLDERKIDNSYE